MCYYVPRTGSNLTGHNGSILALETTSDHPLRMSSATGSALLSFKQSLTLHFRSHCTSYVGQVLELLLLWSIVHDHGAVG